MPIRKFLPILLTFFLKTTAWSQQPAKPVYFKDTNKSKFSSGVISRIDPKDKERLKSTSNGRFWAVVQLERIPTKQDRKVFGQSGVQLFDYLPENGFLASFEKTLEVNDLKSLGIQKYWPIDKEFRNGLMKSIEARGKYLVQLLPDKDSNSIRKSGRIFKEALFLAPQIAEVQLGKSELEELMESPDVLYIAEAPEIKSLNAETNDRQLIGGLHLGNMNTPALKGKGVTVGIGDNGNIFHIDHRYYLEGQRYDGAFHATHVAGIIAGAGFINPSMKGVAPEAKLQVGFFTQILSEAPGHFATRRMQVTNNSYGAGSSCFPTAGIYSASCWTVDHQLMTNPYLMHVFAAGNSGSVTCGNYPMGFKTIDNSFQAAKNVLTVGATNNSAIRFEYSKGPTFDGRIKPEITAIGDGVVSTVPRNTYWMEWGTSMAAPQVTGAMALMIERYRQLNQNQDPRGDLLKAIVCNTATDIHLPGVDYTTGFGMLNVKHAIEVIENRSYRSGEISNQEEWSWKINITQDVPELKVMLYWNDIPPSLFSYYNLVNDLDITVELPDGSVFDPLVLDTSATGILVPARQGKDHLNNIEQVVVPFAKAGTYTVRVKGYRIPSGAQPFQVVYAHPRSENKLVQPAGGEKWVPGQVRSVIWEGMALANGDKPEFYFTIDDGANWQKINLSKERPGLFNWTVPLVQSEKCRLKMVVPSTGETLVSGLFTILPQVNFQLTAICRERVNVSWPKLPGVDSVMVMRFTGEDYAVEGVTADTSFVIEGLSRGPAYWITVAPIRKGVLGERSVARSVVLPDRDCPATSSPGDIAIRELTYPRTQRQFTTLDREGVDTLTLVLSNLGPVNINGLAYLETKDENGVVYQDTALVSIASGRQYTWKTRIIFNINTGQRKRLVGKVWMDGDTVVDNNSFMVEWQYLSNAPIQLPYSQKLASQLDTVYDAPGFTGLIGQGNWDFVTDTKSRLYHSMDSIIPFTLIPTIYGSKVSFVGTYNLSEVDTNTVIRIFLNEISLFNYFGGMAVRGADTLPWLENYFPFIDLVEFLKKAKHPFGKSFQVRVDSWRPTATQPWPVDFNRLSFFSSGVDMNLIYAMEVDTLTSIVSEGDSIKLRVAIENSGTRSSGPYRVGWREDGRVIQEKHFETGLSPSDTAIVDFMWLVDRRDTSVRQLDFFVEEESDSFLVNNYYPTIWYYENRVKQFPYIQGFELDFENNWLSLSGAIKLSESPGVIKGTAKAANGRLFLATAPIQSYPPNGPEFYSNGGTLYSPVFDIREVKNPMLSFSMLPQWCNTSNTTVRMDVITDEVNDYLYAFSSPVKDSNWYVFPVRNLADCPDNRWEVASVILPKNAKKVQFRLSYIIQGNNDRFYKPDKPEGIFWDDMHVFDFDYPISSGQTTFGQGGQTQLNQWVPMLSNGQVSARILSTAKADQYDYRWSFHEGNLNWQGNKLAPFSHVFKGDGAAGEGRVKLYISQKDLALWLDSLQCMDCPNPPSAYDLSLFWYKGPSPSVNENLWDNKDGYWEIWDPGSFDLLPYANGYVLDMPFVAYGEFYLGLNSQSLSMQFNAVARSSPDRAELQWFIDPAGIQSFSVERAGKEQGAPGMFKPIGDVLATGAAQWTFMDPGVQSPGSWYYRIRANYANGTRKYSVARHLEFGAMNQFRVYPNPGRSADLRVGMVGVSGSVSLQLLDQAGRVIWQDTVKVVDNQREFKLNGIPALAGGVYYLKIRSGEEIITKTLVINGK